MKLFILAVTVALASAAKLDRTYLPPSHAQTSGGSGNFLQAPGSDFRDYANQYDNAGNAGQYDNAGQYNNGFNDAFRPERPRAALERSAATLRFDNRNDGETFNYAYETENGIYAEENGVATNGVEAQGGYSYTGDDGQVYTVRYTADQNGFVPQGDHLPTPPPIPEEILKALEQNARDEAAGIYDDGSYNEAKYGDESSRLNGNSNGYNYNANRNTNTVAVNDADSIITDSADFTGVRSQSSFPTNGLSTNGLSNNYLPPNAQASNAAARNYLPPNAQASNAAARNYLPPNAQASNAAARNYLPPNAQRTNTAASRNYLPPQRSSPSLRNNYLPPQRNGQNGFAARGRQPSFSARNGYNY